MNKGRLQIIWEKVVSTLLQIVKFMGLRRQTSLFTMMRYLMFNILTQILLCELLGNFRGWKTALYVRLPYVL